MEGLLHRHFLLRTQLQPPEILLRSCNNFARKFPWLAAFKPKND
jgi:hypothetical protein